MPGGEGRLALVLAVLSLAGSSVEAEAANQPKLRVLFVGNSLTYANDLPAVVARLGAASKLPDVGYRMLAPGGWRRLGTYLAALVIYAGLVNASPVGLPRVVRMPKGRYSVPAARARLLQRAAAEALRRR